MRCGVLVLLVVVVLVAGAIFAWIGLGRSELPPGVSELPPGVSAQEWKPISSDLGLVVQEFRTGKVGGYLMMKVDGQWKRVVLYDPDTLGVIPVR